MTIEKLNIKRTNGKNKITEKFYFTTKIEKTEFHYLITKPKDKKSIEIWNNNFYAAYLIKNNIYALSIDGISKFDFDFKNRSNVFLKRNSKSYINLEKSHNKNNLNELEKLLISQI